MPRSMSQNPFPARATVDGNQAISGTCSERVSTRLVSGDVTFSVNLVSVPTVGDPLEFTLHYHSRDDLYTTEMGHLWRGSFMTSLQVGATVTTLVGPDGRNYPYTWNSVTSTWDQDPNSFFLPATLVDASTEWRLEFDDGRKVVFEHPTSGTARMLKRIDPNGNETGYTWSSGKLTKITEPAGREINLGYYATGSYAGFLETVTDPRGKVTTLVYTGGSGSEKLWKIVGPAGCVLEYLYKTGTNLIETRRDPRMKELAFEYYSSGANEGRLWKVRDSEASPDTGELVYEYGTVPEWIADDYASVPPPYQQDFAFTKLTDARGQVWEFRFEPSGNLWRQIDPLGRQVRHYWDDHQRLLYSTAGFPPPQLFEDYLGPKDNTNNSFWRRAYDDRGNMTQSMDPSGLLTFMTYGSDNRVRSVTPGQAHFGVKGNWAAEFGSQGWVLCAYDSGTDRVKLPAYVDSVASKPTDPLEGEFLATDRRLLDATAPFGRDASVDPALGQHTGERQIAFWKPAASNPNDHFSFLVELNEAASFNLSLYAHAADLATLHGADSNEPLPPFSPQRHYEQYGRALVLRVTDLDGTREFPLFSDAAGVWVTFAVRGDASTDVEVQVEAMAPYNTEARLSAVAFDPVQGRTTTMGYDSYGNLTSVADPLGNGTTLAYWDPLDGTGPGFRLLKEVTDARSKVTKFFYCDTYRNLTRVEDAAGKSTEMTYDLNSNVLTVTDADSYVSTMTWDDKNRLLTSKNNANQQTTLAYDDSGNLESVTDPQGKVTAMAYTGMNRLSTVTDDDGNVWALTWDKAGNLLTMKDPRGHLWTMEYDDAGQLVRVNQPDAQKTDMAYDAQGRMVATVTPYGNQADGSVNTLGLVNLLANGGAEEQDPYDGDPAHARFWDTSVTRTNSRAFEGSYSLQKFGNNGWFSHDAFPASPGVPLLMQSRYYVASSGYSYAATVDLASYFLDGSASSEQETLLSYGSGLTPGWMQLGPTRLTPPALAQKAEARLSLQGRAVSGSGTEDNWWDQVELMPLGTGYTYDPAGRPGRIERPDGSVFQIQHDRFGNVSRVTDALGRNVRFRYDGLDRLVQVTTSLGNTFMLTYDAVGHLATFVEPGSPAPTTTYGYDDVERLSTITYPDSTTEAFTYHDNGNLATYTDNNGQVFAFSYDTANRLWKIEYVGLSQTVEFTYGAAGFVATRKERNGDLTTIMRDDLHRVVGEVFVPGSGSSSPGWTHQIEWDGAGNRLALSTGGPDDRYGVARYGTDHYGGPLWTVADSSGYDSMNRLVEFADQDGEATSMEYDPEGRRTRITYPNGAVTDAVYDFLGRLLSLITTRSSTTLLGLSYSYDANSNRVSQVAGNTTFEYRLDDDDRLVGESINCWTVKTAQELRAGTLSGVDTVTTPDELVLLGWDDGFPGGILNLDRWRPTFSETDLPGFRLRQQEGLYLLFPEGYTTRVFGSEPPIPPIFGLSSPGSALWGAVEHRRLLDGDFTVEVDFDRFQQATATVAGNAGAVRAGLLVNSNRTEIRTGALAAMYRTVAPGGAGDVWESQIQTGSPPPTVATASASGTSGSVRIQRSSGQLSTWYRPSGGSWTQVGSTTSFSGDGLRVALVLETVYAPGAVRFTEFRETAQNNWPTSATYESPIYDSGQDGVAWDNLYWTEVLPANTDVTVDVATQNSTPFGAWSYSGGYSNPAGSSLSGRTGRYLRFRVTLTHTGSATASPEVSLVQATYGTGWQDRTYGFDGRGNMTSKVVRTSAGTVTETRTVNELNQITENEIDDGSSVVTWAYGWDDNGNMTSKANGTAEVWTYEWNEDNRLVGVTQTLGGGPDPELQVAYTYDSLGRMLTRTVLWEGGVEVADPVPARFEWDGWDLVRSVDAEGTETVYYAPLGEIFSFKRGSSVYQMHPDALGSVRAVTDGSGIVSSTFEPDAWGSALADSGWSGDINPQFVGAYGLMADSSTGLHYMRQRWYDVSTSRFLSRDLVDGLNLYEYAFSNPVRFVDVLGLWGVDDPRADNFGRQVQEDRAATSLQDFAKRTKCCSVARKFGVNPAIFCAISYHEESYYNPVTFGEDAAVWLARGWWQPGSTIGPLGLNINDVKQLARRASEVPGFEKHIEIMFGNATDDYLRHLLMNESRALEFFALWNRLRMNTIKGFSEMSLDQQARELMNLHNRGEKFKSRIIGYKKKWDATRAALLAGFQSICGDEAAGCPSSGDVG